MFRRIKYAAGAVGGAADEVAKTAAEFGKLGSQLANGFAMEFYIPEDASLEDVLKARGGELMEKFKHLFTDEEVAEAKKNKLAKLPLGVLILPVTPFEKKASAEGTPEGSG